MGGGTRPGVRKAKAQNLANEVKKSCKRLVRGLKSDQTKRKKGRKGKGVRKLKKIRPLKKRGGATAQTTKQKDKRPSTGKKKRERSAKHVGYKRSSK